jgi:hypothetical protein
MAMEEMQRELQDVVMRRADERTEVAHHVVRMLRNPEYLAALNEGISGAGRDGREVLSKYL